LAAYDADDSGVIDAAELAASPALGDFLSAYDSDGDGGISQAELVARFDALFLRGAEVISLSCTVTDDRRPVADATVKFIPEKFLGDALLPASGVTDAQGVARMAVDKSQLPEDMQGQPLMQVGIYRVEVETGKGTAVFGHEVDITTRGGMSPAFDLKSASN